MARDSSSLERTKIPRRIVRFLVGFSIFWGSAHFCTLFAHRRESRVFPCIVCLTGVFTLQNGPVGGHSFAPCRCAARRHYKRPPAALVFDSVLFTPLGKFFIRALDVVAALHMVAGALGIVDAGSGIVISLSHAALFDHRVRQRNGRQQAPAPGCICVPPPTPAASATAG